jgi:hypothetical protein
VTFDLGTRVHERFLPGLHHRRLTFAAMKRAGVPVNSLISRRKALGGGAAAILALLAGDRVGAGAVTKKKATTTRKKTASKATTTIAAKAVDGAFDPSLELVVTWTYEVTDGGRRIHNPYVGVWVEDSAGVPVRIVHFEYQQGKGRKWLKDMKRWSKADAELVAKGHQSTADTMTNATRSPGTYSVAWDGKDATGKLVPLGTYSLFVEAAREKGPYQFVKTDLTIGTKPVAKDGVPEGDLTAVKLELKVRA